MSEDPFQVGQIDWPDLPEKVEAARHVFRGYIDDLEANFQTRHSRLRQAGLPIAAWCGYGRAGKDEAGLWLSRHSDYAYWGSVSMTLLPLVAWAQTMPIPIAWETRHQNRKYWFQFGNLLRKYDVTCIARWSMAHADMAVGIRAKPELLGCLRDGIVTHAVWVDRPGVEVDPTVEYGREDCTHVLTNDGTLAEYHAKLSQFCSNLGIPLREAA